LLEAVSLQRACRSVRSKALRSELDHHHLAASVDQLLTGRRRRRPRASQSGAMPRASGTARFEGRVKAVLTVEDVGCAVNQAIDLDDPALRVLL
jgi:hypothetical protein